VIIISYNKKYQTIFITLISVIVITSTVHASIHNTDQIEDNDDYLNIISSQEWMEPQVVSTESWAPSATPAFAFESDGTIHIVWQDQTDISDPVGDIDIFYKMKPRGGAWTYTDEITFESDAISGRPSIVVDSEGTCHVAWDDFIDPDTSGYDTDIFYKIKPKNDAWTDAELVSMESDSYSSAVTLIVDDLDNIHALWEDGSDINNCGTDLDILHRLRL